MIATALACFRGVYPNVNWNSGQSGIRILILFAYPEHRSLARRVGIYSTPTRNRTSYRIRMWSRGVGGVGRDKWRPYVGTVCVAEDRTLVCWAQGIPHPSYPQKNPHKLAGANKKIARQDIRTPCPNSGCETKRRPSSLPCGCAIGLGRKQLLRCVGAERNT